MLLLSRYEGQKILVGNDVVITCFKGKKDGEMVIGIDAPKKIAVDKLETRLHKLRQKQLLQ